MGILRAVLSGAGICLVTTTCASTGARAYSVDFGNVVQSSLTRSVDRIWANHGVVLDRVFEAGHSVRYESIWTDRPAPSEEEAREYGNVRHRLVMHGRRLGDEPIFRARLIIEAQAQTEGDSAWRPIATPESVVEYHEAVITALRVELIGSVIRR